MASLEELDAQRFYNCQLAPSYLILAKTLLLIQVTIIFMLLLSADDDDDADADSEDADPNAGRFVRYQFTPQFLKLKTVGAT